MAIVYDDEPKKKSRIIYDDEPAQPEPGIIDRFKARSERVMAPTATAEAMGLKPGIAADIVGAPERTVRAAAGAAGSWADIAATGIGMAGKAANRLSGGRLGKIGGKALETAAPMIEPVAKIGAGYQEWKESQPESTRANLGFAEDEAEFLGTVAVPGAAKKVLDVPKMTGKSIGEPLKKAAKRNVEIEMRPGQWGTNRGYNSGNALKHDLVGKPREVADKSQQILNDLNNQAKAIGEASTEKVFVKDLLSNVRAEFSRKENIHDYDKITSFIDDLEETYLKAHPNGELSLSDALKLRTQIGDKAAFVGARDKGGMTVDPDADWKEKIFNKLYGDIKDDIHAKAGPELQKINRMQSEIIPIRQVALRRLPISESNLRVGLMDAGTIGMGAGLGALSSGDAGDRARNAIAAGVGLGLLRRGAGSKTITRALYKAGEWLSPTAEKPLKSYPKKIDVEKKAPEPITDERRLLPPPMVGGSQKIEPMVPTLGSKLREMGKPEFDAEGMTSKEIYNSKRRLGKLEEKKNLLGKLMKADNPKVAYPNYREGMEKTVLGKKGESGFVGTRTEHTNAEFDRFLGKKLSPKMEAYYKDPKTIEDMRTTIEKLAPAEQSAMIERLKKIYGNDWKDYAPLFGTLGIGAAVSGGGITSYEILNRKK